MDANGVKKKPSLGRKVLLGIGGLLALCCGLSVVAAVVAGFRRAQR
jgi:hypothetical protein